MIEPNFGSMFTNEPLPKDGYITLSSEPGFALVLRTALAPPAPPPRPHTAPRGHVVSVVHSVTNTGLSPGADAPEAEFLLGGGRRPSTAQR